MSRNLGLGYLECQGQILPVIRIELADGAFVVVCQRQGPFRAVSGPATIVGADGNVVVRADMEGNHASWQAIGRGETLTYCFICRPGDEIPNVIQGKIESEGPNSLEPGSQENGRGVARIYPGHP